MSVALALAVAVSAPPAPGGEIAFRQRAVVTGEAVALADVADLSALPRDLQARGGRLIVARFRPGQREMVIEPRRLSEKARALMPVLASRLPAVGSPILVTRQPADPVAEPQTCLVADRSLSVGETPSRDDFHTVACGAAPITFAFRYDAGVGAVRLIRSLKPGDQIVGPPASTFAGVRAGQPLTLVARVGPVRVERQVLVARPSARGRPVFVYGEDGKVFSAPAPGAAQ